MTDANHTHGDLAHALPAGHRDPRAFARARRHSLTVAVLKRALPLVAVAITGGFAAAAMLSDAFDAPVAVANGDLAQGRIVMKSPELSGFDKDNRPFALKAAHAAQDTGTPSVVALAEIDGRIPTTGKAFADIGAKSGLYDADKEILKLSDGIRVDGMQGLDMRLKEAKFDMRAGTMRSDAPVTVRSKDTAIKADSVRVFESGKRILFKQRVRMVIHNSKADLVGDGPTSTRPWIHTDKLSIEKYGRQAKAKTVVPKAVIEGKR